MKNFILKTIVPIIVALLVGFGLNVAISQNEKGETVVKTTTTTIIKATEDVETEVLDDRGELTEQVLPTYEEIDGGQFEDIDTGVSLSEGEYSDLGWSETYNVSSPEAFKNATLGKCITANNRYGAQCVSLARVFWWSYANRDVSTCGTGAAKGMMNCAADNAGEDFEIYGNEPEKIQAGDWLIFDGGLYGHVGMAMGPATNGYVALLGENQGGQACAGGGSATNVINLSVKNLLGFYRPKAYIKPEPQPEPTPEPKPQEEASTCEIRQVLAGDTMADIMKECLGEIDWTKMNEYAAHWRSVGFSRYETVLDGWASAGGYGLFAGDTIKYEAD